MTRLGYVREDFEVLVLVDERDELIGRLTADIVDIIRQARLAQIMCNPPASIGSFLP